MERTLLLVDDEENIVSALVRLLRRDGYRILTANSGKEGLELLTQNKVGVIISDQRMPGMTGVEFLSKVKELYPLTVRIVLSGYTELNSVTDAINHGSIYKFLTKPWEDDLLRTNVDEAFSYYEMREGNSRLSYELRKANEELLLTNQQLKKRVEESTHEAMLGSGILQLSREILEQLPAAVMCIGEDGVIIVANGMARLFFGAGGTQPLLGKMAKEIIPPELLNSVPTEGGASKNLQLADGREFTCWYNFMDGLSQSKGMILTCISNKSKL